MSDSAEHDRPPRTWRSLDELMQTPEFRQRLEREFGQGASEWQDGPSRRDFLKLMGAAIALAGLNGCTRQPEEVIVPYVNAPEQLLPGVPLMFASAMPMGGFGKGVLVENHMGRPTKIEGNPQHPASLGGTDAFMQASVLELYDPDRSRTPSLTGTVSTWSAFLQSLRRAIEESGGAGRIRLRVLTETITSPTLAAQMRRLLRAFPQARWHQWEPLGRDNSRAGARMAFGRDVHVVYDFSKALRIVSLDANFLLEDPGSVRYARQFIANRRVPIQNTTVPDASTMARLYVVESSPSITGAKADHVMSVRPSQVEAFARALAGLESPGLDDEHRRWVQEVLADLRQHAGRSLVLAGEAQPPVVHALVHAINAQLNNVGVTVIYTEPVVAEPVDQLQSLRDLTAALSAGEADALLILESNPALTAPPDLEFARALETFSRQHFTARLGLYEDETSFLCQWHLPQSHYLESWGDVRAFDGMVSIIQPLIAPLYASQSANELLALAANEVITGGYEIVREHWRAQWPREEFESKWWRALHDGVVPDTQARPIDAPLVSAPQQWPTTQPSAAGEMEINFRPDPCIWDGRFANNSWLQELPKPLTKLTWDNAALMSAATAVRLGLASASRPQEANGRVVNLNFQGRQIPAPAMVLPGHADDAVTLYLGYGRRRAGNVAGNRGANAYALRTTDALWFGSGLKISVTENLYPLATTQDHHMLHGRDLVRPLTIDALRAKLDQPAEEVDRYSVEQTPHGKAVHLSLYPEFAYTGYKWGMVIDQTACIGCNACVMACNAENNIPTVGKTGVLRAREMHWLRIDTYYQGHDFNDALSNPQPYFQPMLCQHCEKAPCEVVCPVAATSHSSEGINEMTYNRCIGTRYCSNNCPYKVRRFNFFNYIEPQPVRAMQRNPEVTVRTRGVMEKCTFCIQRINRARIEAKTDHVQAEARGEQPKLRRVESDGQITPDPLPPIDIQTACQQACPTQAIVFGDMNDADSAVHRLKSKQPYTHLNYGLLVELNTQPRVTYLAHLRNPNPELTR